MKIEAIIEFLFLTFFFTVIIFIALGIISIIEIANYFIGEDISGDAKATAYAIIGAVCLFILYYFFRRIRNINKLI